MNTLHKSALEQAAGSLKAALDDVNDELASSQVDVCMIDGAIFHAHEAIGTMQKLVAAIQSETC